MVVNQQNTWATCLSVAELKKIWEPIEGGQLAGRPFVLPRRALKLFGLGTDSGTFEYFTEAINGRARASRSDYQASEDDNVLVQASGERGGMGYFGYSYYTENRAERRPDPQPEDRPVRRAGRRLRPLNTYKPLSRPLFIYAKGSSFKRREVQAFLDYIFDNEVKIAAAPGSCR